MKLVKLLTVMLFVCSSFIAGADNGKKLKANESEVWYAVAIDCPSCEQKLMAQLPYIKGVKDVKIDIDKQVIWFLYRNDKTDKKVISAELEKLGYPGKEITEEQAEARVPVDGHNHAH